MDSILGWGRSAGGGHGNHSSILAWRIPWAEEPKGLQSIGLHRVRHDWSDLTPLRPMPGKGNGNPLQYSCLESPVDRGAWWAATYGVSQSRTQLSSSSKAHAHFIVFTKMHTSRSQLAHHYNHPTTYQILHMVDPHKMLQNKYSGIPSPIEC